MSHPPGLRESATFDRNVIHEIQRAAETGLYDIRGWGAKRRLPNFDDLVFLGASMSRYPLEGYRERCATDVVLGTRFAKKPLHLKIPITIAGMSFGALSAPHGKVAIDRQVADRAEGRWLVLAWRERGGPPSRPARPRSTVRATLLR